VALGGSLVRNDLHFILDVRRRGSSAERTLRDEWRATRGHHSKIDHAQPYCPSRELYKGILSGKSSAVFQRWIVVRQIAQRPTPAEQ